jgi:hypothetical protein
MAVTTATITTQGLALLLEQEITTALSPTITYVALGTGCGTLSGPILNGSAYVSLPLAAPLPVAVPSGASLTLINGTNSQTVTEAGGGAPAGATAITVSSTVANHAYPVGSGVVTTPLASDTQLFAEAYRDATSAIVTGAAAGEAFASLYIASPEGATTTYLEVGYFAGSASATPNSGILVARAVYWFPHVVNADSAMAQLDLII